MKTFKWLTMTTVTTMSLMVIKDLTKTKIGQRSMCHQKRWILVTKKNPMKMMMVRNNQRRMSTSKWMRRKK
jgi:hypothetical protein